MPTQPTELPITCTETRLTVRRALPDLPHQVAVAVLSWLHAHDLDENHVLLGSTITRDTTARTITWHGKTSTWKPGMSKNPVTHVEGPPATLAAGSAWPLPFPPELLTLTEPVAFPDALNARPEPCGCCTTVDTIALRDLVHGLDEALTLSETVADQRDQAARNAGYVLRLLRAVAAGNTGTPCEHDTRLGACTSHGYRIPCPIPEIRDVATFLDRALAEQPEDRDWEVDRIWEASTTPTATATGTWVRSSTDGPPTPADVAAAQGDDINRAFAATTMPPAEPGELAEKAEKAEPEYDDTPAPDPVPRIPPEGTRVTVKGWAMPGVPGGTLAVVRHQAPGGHSNLPRLVWLELDDRIQWSHGRSEHPGFWAHPAEFDVDEATATPDRIWDEPGPDGCLHG